MNFELLAASSLILILALVLKSKKRITNNAVKEVAPQKVLKIDGLNSVELKVFAPYLQSVERFVRFVDSEFEKVEIKVITVGESYKCEVICHGNTTLGQLISQNKAASIEFNTLKNKVELNGSELVATSYFKNYGSHVHSGISFNL